MKARGYSTIAGLEKLTPEEIKQRNLETYGSKIKQFRIRANMTAEQLADILQIAKSSVRNWECGLTRPDPEYLYRMFSILDVEPNEFFGIGGIGTILTPKEKDILHFYRNLDSRSQRDLELFVKTLISSARMRNLNKVYYSICPVPDHERYLAAGSIGEDWPDNPERNDILLYADKTVKETDEIFTVSGDSMEPQFHNGDKVLVKYCTEIRNGDIGAYHVPGIGGVIKQKAHDRLHSLNPDYDDIFPYEEGANLVGRVIGIIDKDMIPPLAERQAYEEAEEERKKDPEFFDSFDDD